MQLNSFAATVLLACMATAAPLDKRQFSFPGLGGGSSGGDANSGACADYTFLYACGTTESGLGSVGSPLSQGLKQALGSVNTVATNYPASIAGNAQLGGAGGPQMASDAKNALSKCPNTKLIIGGYSQGAMVATNAVKAQGLPAYKVVAALLFGNPFQNQGGGKIGSIPTLSICNAGDGVCTTGGFVITAAHLTYSSDGSVQKAVQFAQQNARSAGSGGYGGSGYPPTTPDALGTTGSAGSGTGTGTGTGTGAGGLPSFGGGLGGLGGGLGGLGGLSGGGLGGLGGSSGGGFPSFGGLGGSSGGGLPSFGGLGGSGGSSGGLGSFLGKSGGFFPSFGGLGGSSGGGLGSLGGLGSFGKMFGGK